MISFEKARYNICYVVNSSRNAIDNYKKDIIILDKFNKNVGIEGKKFESKLNKISGQFVFKKNEERQRKIRIEACLNAQTMDDEEENRRSKYSNKNNFKSIINSKLITNLLKHCKKEQRNQITTHRINNEIEGENWGNEIEIPKGNKGNKVIKLNF